ncbi:hypothetical protein SAMN05216410_1645 [Sanguibacter gelidistatuariae]|uniref:DUF4157 domain-containing protein n=1 Tax=Sanguibacter gelidistatuariae TaxID=1814289 RepID=A0A1G6KNJ6_9MICO|nr:hypothetical protein [Sanguibacter gelidistatuariae]SDC32649.1 hypothetical protein SAMN05216410_1645 [Sanguibacter gelidistatuariae]
MTRSPGAALARFGAVVLSVAVALGVCLAPASASPAGAAVPGAAVPTTSVPDYSTGPFAGRLCGGGRGDFVCVAARAVTAMTQGSGHRADAVAQGRTCEVQSGLWVCFGIESILAQRGGTTYGDTFLTSRGAEALAPGLLAHESEHVRQWRLFGPDFALLYLLEGTDPCANYFEIAAGLDAGGYTCP